MAFHFSPLSDVAGTAAKRRAPDPAAPGISISPAPMEPLTPGGAFASVPPSPSVAGPHLTPMSSAHRHSLSSTAGGSMPLTPYPQPVLPGFFLPRPVPHVASFLGDQSRQSSMGLSECASQPTPTTRSRRCSGLVHNPYALDGPVEIQWEEPSRGLSFSRSSTDVSAYGGSGVPMEPLVDCPRSSAPLGGSPPSSSPHPYPAPQPTVPHAGSPQPLPPIAVPVPPPEALPRHPPLPPALLAAGACGVLAGPVPVGIWVGAPPPDPWGSAGRAVRSPLPASPGSYSSVVHVSPPSLFSTPAFGLPPPLPSAIDFASSSVSVGHPAVPAPDPSSPASMDDPESQFPAGQSSGGPAPPDCFHPKPWKRLRAKRGFTFFVCRQCGKKWRVPSAPVSKHRK